MQEGICLFHNNEKNLKAVKNVIGKANSYFFCLKNQVQSFKS